FPPSRDRPHLVDRCLETCVIARPPHDSSTNDAIHSEPTDRFDLPWPRSWNEWKPLSKLNRRAWGGTPISEFSRREPTNDRNRVLDPAGETWAHHSARVLRPCRGTWSRTGAGYHHPLTSRYRGHTEEGRLC